MLLVPATAGCQSGILNPQGSVGLAEKVILIDTMAIMLAIVVPTILATLTFAWWFRASNAKARYLPNWAFSGRIELIVWSIPLLTILLLGGVAWIGAHELDPAKSLPSKAPAFEVQVVSLDWKWLFIYPGQGIASVNQLAIPAGAPVHFTLTSASVMNAFFVPQLGSMVYTMNGMTSQLNLVADRPGTLGGISAHFSGDGFSNMHFEVRALAADQFAAWVAEARRGHIALDAKSYAQLARQSENIAPFTYNNADPVLFPAIVSQAVPPAPGPQIGLPAVNVSNRTER